MWSLEPGWSLGGNGSELGEDNSMLQLVYFSSLRQTEVIRSEFSLAGNLSSRFTQKQFLNFASDVPPHPTPPHPAPPHPNPLYYTISYSPSNYRSPIPYCSEVLWYILEADLIQGKIYYRSVGQCQLLYWREWRETGSLDTGVAPYRYVQHVGHWSVCGSLQWGRKGFHLMSQICHPLVRSYEN